MRVRIAACFPLLFVSVAAVAEPPRDGVPDPRFGTNGVASYTTIGTTGISIAAPRDVVEQADGRLLVVGHGRRTGSSRSQPMVMRVFPDGSLDGSFGDQGVFLAAESGFTEPNGGHASAAVVLDDGRIVVVGSLRDVFNFSNTGCTLVFSLTSAGALDTSWGPAPGPACLDFGRPFGPIPDAIGNIARGPGASVYVNGLLGNGSPGTAVLARLDANGLFDSTYDGDGLAFFGTNFFTGIARHGLRVAADGSAWVLGGIGSGAAVAGLDPNGQPVAAFGAAGFASIDAFPGLAENAITFDVDLAGRIAVITYSYEIAATIANAVIRFATNGQLDASFNSAGQQPGMPGIAYLAELGTQIPGGVQWRDSRIVAVGAPGFTVVSLLPDASFDAAFGDAATPGRISRALGTALFARVLSDADIVVAGAGANPVTMLKLTSDGVFVDGFE